MKGANILKYKISTMRHVAVIWLMHNIESNTIKAFFQESSRLAKTASKQLDH